MKVSAQYAREHFDEIASAVDHGEAVEIERGNRPTLRLVPCPPGDEPRLPGRRVLGAGRGELCVPDEAEWKRMDEETNREMNDAPLMSSGEI